jgi:hypothetical protein
MTDIENVSTEPATSGDGGPAKVKVDDQAPNTAEYDFVRFPDGTIHAIPKSVIASQNAGVNVPSHDQGPARYYLWLSNGDVETVDADKIPGPAGAQSPHGYWEKDGHVFEVVGCYAVPDSLSA